MGLFNPQLSIHPDDRPRIDRALAIMERITTVTERIIQIIEKGAKDG